MAFDADCVVLLSFVNAYYHNSAHYAEYCCAECHNLTHYALCSGSQTHNMTAYVERQI
jgi:hypothetical protein